MNPNFFSTHRYDLLGTDVGRAVCWSDEGTPRMDWSIDALRVGATVSGSDRYALQDWWDRWHMTPQDKVVAELNARSSPPFPTSVERKLLGHIPEHSRVNCIRPTQDQVRNDLGGAHKTAVAAVICGPTSGTDQVVYYQFPDTATMRAAFDDPGGYRQPCTVTETGQLVGGGPYREPDGRAGLSRCSTPSDYDHIEWTNDQLAIAVYALDYGGSHGGEEMIDWWYEEGGPF